MARLFVAVDVPEEQREMLEDVMKRLSALGARPAGRGNMHITLLFLGEVPDSRIPEITAVVGGVKAKRFDCEIAGLDSIPKGRPSVIYARIAKGAPELAAINSELREGIAALGMATERRPYMPHLTLARTRQKSDFEGIRRLVADSAGPAFAFACADIRLKSSVLSSGGAAHTDLFVRPLA